MAEYKAVQKSSLKLKGVSDSHIKKKKKKKDKDRETKKKMEQMIFGADTTNDDKPKEKTIETRTRAELAFEKTREKRNAEELLKKADKTHKERIMEFNQHLDTLTEHFDIPKVSWTK